MKTKTLYELHFYEYNRGSAIYHKESVMAYNEAGAIRYMQTLFSPRHIEVLYCEDKSDDNEG